jgi:8-oxo-dGTP pyrophosphatase MutT (NUDIX family)
MNPLNAGSGVKALILKERTVLILQKANGDPDLPGGRVEAHETSGEALRREFIEELGPITVEILGPVAEWSFRKRLDLMIEGTTWLCCYESGPISLSNEHSAFNWVPLDQLQDTGIHLRYGLDNLGTESIERGKIYERGLPGIS